MTTTPNPTAEQILVDEWIRQADRAKSMTGMDAIWFPDAEETLAVLRANGLLSEGTPSEEHPEFCYCGQILKREDKIDFYTLKCPKLQCGGFRMVPKRSAGVASQEVIDDAADEQDDLRLHMLAPQVPSAVTDINGHSWMAWNESGKNGTYCRSCGGWAGKVGNRQCSPAPVLPSSGVDEVRAEAVREVARYINRIAPNGLVPKKMILADMEFAADRLGRGIHANGNDRAVQGGESRGE